MADKQRRNPKWTRDELIVALQFYFNCKGAPPDKQSREIQELSDALNKMRTADEKVSEKYRNRNGVYMKLMNFRRFDPYYASKGRVGLSRGGKEEQQIWDEFFNRPNELKAISAAIVSNSNQTEQRLDLEEDVAEAEEGRLLTRVHLARERSREIVAKKKSHVLKTTGKLLCEVCEFDFEEIYGERGRGFAEVHHSKPLHTLSPGTKTKLDDLTILCANCHRMVHSRKPWLDVAELRNLIKRRA